MTRPVRVEPGPWLLRSTSPELAIHERLRGSLPDLDTRALLRLVQDSGLRGRGGAGFPFATKLQASLSAPGRRRHVVVNLSEGEPASAKDLALALHQPHLVLDGASLVARALRSPEVHLVTAEERPEVREALVTALAERRHERRDRRLRWRLHLASSRFVAGEASAVTELIEGRSNLPVTTWRPTAVAGLKGQPTLLSNAETYAQVAALALPGGVGVPGTSAEPGTRLLSIGEASGATRVVEVAHGAPWRSVLSARELAAPVLLGGSHGAWAAAGALEQLTVSHADLQAAGLGLGAGVVLPLAPGTCPLRATAGVTRYLARQSAGRCGPCHQGLPALATALDGFLVGGSLERVERLRALVTGRGACAHPDGTARLVASALSAFPAEVAAHASGECLVHRPALVAVGAR
ncbi:MAG TPA: NADH-ubiquinone oxidoreductase-F iron-sulfur binding region domain-containing protein [Marmoricola sp.]|nr:NADH-ubiquinone oxidoreductase-F iron-sulfur binding region domain-containing protein [Marmoricola sp.]